MFYLLSLCWVSILSGQTSPSSLVTPCEKSVPVVISPSLSRRALPTPSPPERYSVDHASRVSTWASTQAAQTVRAATLTPHASTRAQSGKPLRVTHPGVLPPTRAHPSPGESKGRGRGPGDQSSFPGPPPPPVSSRRGCRHGNARSLGPARQAPSRCRPRRLPRPQQALRAVYGDGRSPRRLRRRPG